MTEAMRELIAKARSDHDFLDLLLSDPLTATKGFGLDEQERTAIATNTAVRLGMLVAGGALRAGCGDTPTCDITCPVTCKSTNPIDTLERLIVQT